MSSRDRANFARKPAEASNGAVGALSELISHLRRGQLARALELIESERRSIDLDETASYVAGLVCAAHGNPAKACEHFEATLVINPLNARALEARAIALQNMGRHHEAVAASEALARIEERNPAAWRLLGASQYQAGAYDSALSAYSAALLLDEGNVSALAGKALTLHALQRHREACAIFEKALEAAPFDKTLWHNQGASFAALDEPEPALACFLTALELDSRYVAALEGASFILSRLKRFADAVALCDRALALAPDHKATKLIKANALHDLKRFREALLLYEEALEKNPDDLVLAVNRGMTLLQSGAFEEALTAAAQALRLAPEYTPALRCLATAQLRLARDAEALASFDRALQATPRDADLWCGRAIALKELSRFGEALESFDAALAVDPNHIETKANLGALRLLLGQYEEGLPLFEYRWIRGEKTKIELARPWPEWKGESLWGKRLLVTDEAGLGDVIQYCRYLPLLARNGAIVDFACRASMHALLNSLGESVSIIERPEADASYDFCVSLCTLPYSFGTQLETIPAPKSYLHADPERIELWRRRIGDHGFKVGVAWRGSSHANSDNSRAAPLASLAPLASVAGVRLISLQKNAGVEEVETLHDRGAQWLETLDKDMDADGRAFVDTAAIIANLDLVISIDTSIAHLSGALGKNVWIALKRAPEWRWLLERPDSPWYPTARLFRQQRKGDWSELFSIMAKALEDIVARSTQQTKSPILLPGSAGELIDRLTILQIKLERISNRTKHANVARELSLLEEARSTHALHDPRLNELEHSLKEVNQRLWDIEDSIRLLEKAGDFGPDFIRLARNVYKENDHRARLKRRINLLFGSRLIEEKSYGEDQPPGAF